MPEFIFISQAEGSIHINSDFNFSIFLSEFCDDTPISYGVKLAGISWGIDIFKINKNFKNKFQEYISNSSNGISPYAKKFYYESIRPLAEPEYVIIAFIKAHDQIPKNYISLVKDLLSLSLKEYNSSKTNDFRKCLENALRKLDPLLSSSVDIYLNYDLYDSYGQGKIGESDRNKRKCRFCGRTIEDGVKFSNKAHIIPEAFGNKKFICNEECDNCNHFFGENIETHLIKYFDFFRVFSQTKGKEGPLKIHFDNNNILSNRNIVNIPTDESSSNNMIYIVNKTASKTDSIDINNLSIPFKIKNIVEQNIYKSIIKMGINFLPPQYLSYFSETIKWLLGQKQSTELPLGFRRNNFSPSSPEPSLGLFIRSNDNFNLPFLIVSFHFYFTTFFLIAPFCSQDRRTFITPQEIEDTKNILKPILDDNYDIISLNSLNPIEYIINLNLKHTPKKQ